CTWGRLWPNPPRNCIHFRKSIDWIARRPFSVCNCDAPPIHPPAATRKRVKHWCAVECEPGVSTRSKRHRGADREAQIERLSHAGASCAHLGKDGRREGS